MNLDELINQLQYLSDTYKKHGHSVVLTNINNCTLGYENYNPKIILS